MATRSRSRSLALAPHRRAGDRLDTRAHLLEAAGHVFAEKGFDRATGKEICERAGTNTAAVNYYFGGIEGLYAAVLLEAHGRLLNFDKMAAAVAGQPDAQTKLRALLGLIVETLLGRASSSWEVRVIGREVMAPSPAFTVIRESEIPAKSRILKAIVGELTRLSPDHPAVARVCLSIIAPCLMLAIADRSILKRVFPQLGLGSADAPTLTDHMVRYALAGLAAVAEDKKN
jgi:TetR/AcrR family transcriptional regulator, regulator of cefoperazone and chloramphenicol sensitivity